MPDTCAHSWNHPIQHLCMSSRNVGRVQGVSHPNEIPPGWISRSGYAELQQTLHTLLVPLSPAQLLTLEMLLLQRQHLTAQGCVFLASMAQEDIPSCSAPISSQLFSFLPQETTHHWPLMMMSFREFTYHFRVAQPVSTRSCLGQG